MTLEVARFRAWVVVAVGLAGCVVTEANDGLGPDVEFESADALVAQGTDLEVEGLWDDFRAAACPKERQIAKAAAAQTDCPKFDGWSQTSLFEDGSPWLAAQAGTLLPYTGPLWCRYEWDPKLGDTWDADGIGALTESNKLSDLSSDCEVVHPQASAISELVAEDMRTLFRERIARVDVDDLVMTGGGVPPRKKVAVMVVDTMPTDLPPNPRSRHGEDIARFIIDVACPEGVAGCKAEVYGVLGLPRYAGGVDHQRGGYVGSQGDLAASIIEAVQVWEQTYAGQSPAVPLIINLSVGWDPAAFGGLSAGSSTVAVDAVYAALEVASCHGALVVAAAGNDAGMCTTGATAPASWEVVSAPDNARCAALGLPSPGPSSASYRPLVHAVGGLHLDDAPMPGARPDSRPRMMATSTYAVAGNSQLTTALTGTSVAAAVVSGAAALVWSHDLGLDAHEVMELLYQSGPSLGSTADLAVDDQQLESHKLDVCSAMEAACTQNAGCPGLALGCLTAPDTVTVGTVLAVAASATPEYTPMSEFSTDPTVCEAVCGSFSAEVLGAVGATSGDPCAATDPIPIGRYLSPQPGSPGCPNCTLEGDLVNASLAEVYAGSVVEDVVVILSNDDGETRFDFGNVPLDVDSITRLQLDPLRMPSEIREARISVTLVGKRPVENELIRW